MSRVISILVLVSLCAGCGGVIAGRNLRAGRDEFSTLNNCPKKEVKATNEGKYEFKNPPDNLMGANKILVEGCGRSERYVCATFDTGDATSRVVCEQAK